MVERIYYDNPETERATARMGIAESLMHFFAARRMWAAANAMAKAHAAATANWVRLMNEDEAAAISPTDCGAGIGLEETCPRCKQRVQAWVRDDGSDFIAVASDCHHAELCIETLRARLVEKVAPIVAGRRDAAMNDQDDDFPF